MNQAAAELFREHQRVVWAMSYRLTGSAADADDIVQETFARLVASPPPRLDEPMRPWLSRVAVNLGRDLLRRRKRQGYEGPWLPSPIESEPPSHEVAREGMTTEGRYDLIESCSYAFLIALEELTPNQRAVLLLRDVFDYSVRETADALALSETNVKTTLHRARRAMAAYDGARARPTPERAARTTSAIERLVTALVQDDVAAVEALLAHDVVESSDGGSEFFAAKTPIVGAAKVARFMATLVRHRGPALWGELRWLNGLPALVAEFAPGRPREATRMVLRVEVDEAGHITALQSILATAKLTAIRFPGAAGT